METKSPGESTFQANVSRVALLLALASLAYVAIRIPTEQRIFAKVFDDFQLKLPAATEIILAIPDAVFAGLAGTLALLAIAFQVLMRNKGSVMVFQLLLVICCWVALAAYRVTMLQPLLR